MVTNLVVTYVYISVPLLFHTARFLSPFSTLKERMLLFTPFILLADLIDRYRYIPLFISSLLKLDSVKNPPSKGNCSSNFKPISEEDVFWCLQPVARRRMALDCYILRELLASKIKTFLSC